MSAAVSSEPEVARRSPYQDAPRLPDGEALTAERIFGTSPPPPTLELEIGPGRGGFIVERLAANPDAHVLGLEIRLKWASLVDEKVRSLGLGGRGRVFAEDIRSALPRFAPGSLSHVFIHFPDPWWKKRHAKRRLAHALVVDQVARALAVGGELFVQTDVWDTAQAYRQSIEACTQFEPQGDAAGSPELAENPYGARSPRERRVMADGIPVMRLRYRRRADGAA
jgi:tRNA (guanine-N7-)-methyltransferase